MDENKVTVIVPTYNRAHILEKTIPTYLDNNSVLELIIVDDFSKDNTKDVVSKLIKQYKQIKYIKTEKNIKQPAANNVGIKYAKGKFIYFGDDDSFLKPNTIDKALSILLKNNVDLVAARPIYLNNENDLLDVDRFVSSIKEVSTLNISDFRVDFQRYNPPNNVLLPFCNACFIISTELARKIMFDENFTGNALREETDFTIRAYGLYNAKILYVPSIIQYNYPRAMATGGAHHMNKAMYHFSSIRNNWYFLRKNKEILYHKLKIKNIFYLQFFFTIRELIKIIIRR